MELGPETVHRKPKVPRAFREPKSPTTWNAVTDVCTRPVKESGQTLRSGIRALCHGASVSEDDGQQRGRTTRSCRSWGHADCAGFGREGTTPQTVLYVSLIGLFTRYLRGCQVWAGERSQGTRTRGALPGAPRPRGHGPPPSFGRGEGAPGQRRSQRADTCVCTWPCAGRRMSWCPGVKSIAASVKTPLLKYLSL